MAAPRKKKAAPIRKPFVAVVAFRLYCPKDCGWETLVLPDNDPGAEPVRCPTCGEIANQEPLSAAYRCPSCGSQDGIVSIAGPSQSTAPICRQCTSYGLAVPMVPSDDSEGESTT